MVNYPNTTTQTTMAVVNTLFEKIHSFLLYFYYYLFNLKLNLRFQHNDGEHIMTTILIVCHKAQPRYLKLAQPSAGFVVSNDYKQQIQNL